MAPEEGPRPALPVAGHPDFAAGPPTTAEEYLRQVRWEARRIPDVISSGLDPQALGSGGGGGDGGGGGAGLGGDASPPPPPWAQPSDGWVAALHGEFGALREELAAAGEAGAGPGLELPRGLDEPGWRRFCLGEGAGARAHLPTVSTLLALPEATVPWLLQRLVEWITERGGHAAPSRMQALWVFALGAAVSEPLGGDTAAALRALVVHLRKLRAAAASPADPGLAVINTLLAIAGGYFAQDEGLVHVLHAKYA